MLTPAYISSRDKITLILNTTQRREHKQKQCGRVILVSGIQPSSVPFFDSCFSGNEVSRKTSATLRNNFNKSSPKISGAGHRQLYEAGNKKKA